MIPILAQASIDAIPAGFWKSFTAAIIVLIAVAAMLVGLWATFRKSSVTIEPQPVEVRKAPKRFNHDLCVTQHIEVNRRLDGHDVEINSLWNTLRSEDTAIRKEMRDQFNVIERCLGRIEGKLDSKGKNQ